MDWIFAHISVFKPEHWGFDDKRAFKDDFSPDGPETRWVPCQPCSDAWEVFAPTHVTLHRQRDLHDDSVTPGIVTMHRQLGGSFYSLLFGPNRQPCLKVSETFWTIESLSSRWRESTTCELDSRCVRRLVRAYGRVKKDEAFPGSTGVVDQCLDFDWDELGHLARVMDHPYHYATSKRTSEPHSALVTYVVRPAAGLTLAGICYGGLHLTAWTCSSLWLWLCLSREQVGCLLLRCPR